MKYVICELAYSIKQGVFSVRNIHNPLITTEHDTMAQAINEVCTKDKLFEGKTITILPVFYF